ncbi:hypothetical protein Hanom_Chr13g01206381 [Helianthus anomalus]
MKQIEDNPKEKSRALAVIQDDEGFNWNGFLLEEDAVGYASMAEVETKSTYDRERSLAQRKYKKNIKINAEKRAEKERLRQGRYEEYLRSKESKKVDEGIIDVKAEMTAENLTKMVDQVMMAKALEVDSTSASESESSEKVSSSGSDSEPSKAKKAKSESDWRNCMKECKVCNTHEYLSRPQIQELTNKINILNREVIA